MGEVDSRPNIFEATDFRAYLKNLYEFLKRHHSHFTFRSFSREAGFTSPNFLKLVMDGKRNVSSESIDRFAKALKFNRKEAAFFRTLVLFNQATTTEERRFYAEQILRSKMVRRLHPLKAAQFAYYDQWFFVPVRELVGTIHFQEEAEWIASALNPPITPAQARSALETLLKLKLIRRNEKGKLVQTDAIVATDDEVTSASIAQFHREMIQKGSEAIERFKSEERDISAVTLGLSKAKSKKLKEMIQKFRQDVLALAADEKNPEDVYQVNFQLFPLSQLVPRRGRK